MLGCLECKLQQQPHAMQQQHHCWCMVLDVKSSASAHKHMHLQALVDGPVCNLSCLVELPPCVHLQDLLLQY